MNIEQRKDDDHPNTVTEISTPEAMECRLLGFLLGGSRFHLLPFEKTNIGEESISAVFVFILENSWPRIQSTAVPWSEYIGTG